MLALRTQQVIYEETGIAAVTDPLAGSYFVETLTDQVEAAAWEYINKIDAMGGAMRAIEMGYIQQQIQDAAYAYQQAVEKAEQIVVGMISIGIAGFASSELLRWLGRYATPWLKAR